MYATMHEHALLGVICVFLPLHCKLLLLLMTIIPHERERGCLLRFVCKYHTGSMISLTLLHTPHLTITVLSHPASVTCSDCFFHTQTIFARMHEKLCETGNLLRASGSHYLNTGDLECLKLN